MKRPHWAKHTKGYAPLEGISLIKVGAAIRKRRLGFRFRGRLENRGIAAGGIQLRQ
jgi:hypothetical protein